MRKIALRGLVGRRRETLLLWTVAALAFLFLALPTTLITSIEATDAAQRKATYGAWQVMASGLTEERAGELAGYGDAAVILPMIPVSGADYFQADNSFYFTPYSPALAELGQFQLRQGRWPEAEDEVVLEYARLASLGLEVGDTFTVQCEMELPMTEEHIQENAEAYEAALAESRAQARAIYEEPFRNFFLYGDWEIVPGGSDRKSGTLRVEDFEFSLGEARYWPRYMDDAPIIAFFLFWEDLYPYQSALFADAEHPEGLVVPLEELTDEQFNAVLDVYLDNVLGAVSEKLKQTSDLLGVGALSVRVQFSDGLRASGPMSLRLIYKYTVCGVVETYTDRWDSGRVDLPSGFITESNRQLLLAGEQAALEKYPFFGGGTFGNLVLLQGGEASALCRKAIDIYNRDVLERYGFTAPRWQCRGADPVFDESGALTSCGEMHDQIQFSLALADPDAPRRGGIRLATAWLVLPGSYESYCQDHLLSEADGYYINGLEGSLRDLTEREEDLFRLNRSAEHGEYGGFIDFSGDLDAASVALDLDGQRYEIPLADFLARDFTVGGLAPADMERCVFLEDLEEQTDFVSVRLNRLAYPSSAEDGGNMLALVMGILFVTTVCAVFQICFTQIRRRLRRVVLLKSLGGTSGQIAGMMAWEFLYLWLAAAPAGTALGLLGAYVTTGILGGSQGRDVLLVIDPAVLAAALLAGTAALALGMAVPAVMAVGVPLTGRTVRKKPLPPPKRETRQDFLHVTLRGLSAKKGRTAGLFALCSFMMAIAVFCLFLGFQMLREYREAVVRDGRPDYLLRSPYAMSLRQREEYLAELEALGVCGGINTYFAGADVRLDRSAWEASPLAALAAGDTQEEPAESVGVDLWTFSSADPLFARLQSAATAGTLDPAAFDEGRQVLLLIPLYRDTGRVDEDALAGASGWDRLAASGMETSWYAEYDGVYSRDTAVQVGDSLPLYTEYWTIRDEAYVSERREAAPTVGAILYYFPDTAVWPLGCGEGWQIAASPKVLSTLLDGACKTRSGQTVRAIYLQQSALSRISGTYGATDFYIDRDRDVSPEEADTALLIYARNHSMEIEVYHESSEKLLRDGLNNVLLVCLLGLTALLLSLIIFFNTVASDIEQERPRIGILQALGVSNALLIRRQLILGLAASVLALAVGNGLLWGCAAAFAAGTGAVAGNLLWGYPLWGHILLCLALAAVITALFVVPMARLRRYLPVENIRT